MTTQQEFIGTIQNALTDVRHRQNKEILTPVPPEDYAETLSQLKAKDPEKQTALLEELKANAAPINLKVIEVATAKQAGESIVALVAEKEPEYGTKKSVAAWNHPLVDSLEIDPSLDQMDIPLIRPPKENAPDQAARDAMRKGVIDSFVGITSADYCVADTATMTMKTTPGCPRSVSLVPMIHVGVIRMDQIVASLEELYFRLQWDPAEQEKGLTNCMTFISGPSKTGDIELVMVHGAHGPREVYLYVITG